MRVVDRRGILYMRVGDSLMSAQNLPDFALGTARRRSRLERHRPNQLANHLQDLACDSWPGRPPRPLEPPGNPQEPVPELVAHDHRALGGVRVRASPHQSRRATADARNVDDVSMRVYEDVASSSIKTGRRLLEARKLGEVDLSASRRSRVWKGPGGSGNLQTSAPPQNQACLPVG